VAAVRWLRFFSVRNLQLMVSMQKQAPIGQLRTGISSSYNPFDYYSDTHTRFVMLGAELPKGKKLPNSTPEARRAVISFGSVDLF
jgi:hypothetical protein